MEKPIEAYSTEETVGEGGTIQLEALPFSDGEVVQIIVVRKAVEGASATGTLEGSVLKYDDPFEPVAQDEWTATQ